MAKRFPKQRHDVYNTFKLDKFEWTIYSTPYQFKDVYGYVDHEKKLIVIDGTLDSAMFLDTLLHETSHAFNKYESEPKVLKRGRAYSAALLAAQGLNPKVNRRKKK